MANYYWIKLYIEILDDPKMGRLPEHLWNCAIKFFLLAGDMNQDGLLPSINDMAWRLRCSVEDIETDLADLAAVNITRYNGTGWIVTNFSKRQEHISDADRMKAYRERKQKALYYGNEGRYESVTSRNVDKESDIDKDTEEESDKSAAPAAAIQFVPQKQEQIKHYQESDILKLVCAASGMVAIPPKELQRIDQLYRLLESYGWDDTLSALKASYQKWTSTPRKNGTGNYSGINFAWVDWAQDFLAGNRPKEKSTSEMTDQEYIEWAKKQVEANA